MHTLTEKEVSELYTASLRDLSEVPSSTYKKDLAHFTVYINANSIHGRMHLKNQKLGFFATLSIAQFLERNIWITRLNLSENNLGDDGLKVLAQALFNNYCLVSLNLSSVNMSY